MTTLLRRAVTGALAAALATGAALVVPRAAVAVEGLETGAVSRYVLDTSATTVHATMTLQLRNTNRNKVVAGGVYTYYYNAYSVPVPRGATALKATSGGSALGVSLAGTDDPSTGLARITFPNLGSGSSRTITLSFDIPGEPPRSKDNTRVGPGYATFVAYGAGDPGRNRVEIVAPTGMSFSSTVDGFTPTETGATTTYTATENTFDGGLWAVVSLRDPKQASEKVVDVAGTSLTLEAFPDDARWTSFVAATVTEGIPSLEKLVGTPWPGGLSRIREDASPSLRGYDGWFDPSDDEIVVGEQLDEDLIFHELSHAWISSERFDERWVSEGLAQVVAERAVKAKGDAPMVHEKVSRSASEAVPLNSWDGSAGTRSSDVDAWAYPAAYRATRDLFASLDDTGFAAVVGAGIRGERAYDPPGRRDPSGGRTNWQRWLDLVETRGKVTAAPTIFATWALTAKEKALLAPRASARTAYAALDAADGAWLPPEGLRDAMTSWDFDRAASVRQAVQSLSAPARAVQDAARRAGLEVPDAVRDSYEKAALDDQYGALRRSLPAAAAAITTVGSARAAQAGEDDPFSRLGASVLGVGDRVTEATSLVETGQVAKAEEAATGALDRHRWVLAVGIGIPVLVLLVLVGAVTLLVLGLRRRSEHPQHAGVAQGVGLDPLEVEELRDPLVVGAQQLGVDRRLDGLPVDRREPVAGEEPRLEGEAEQPREAEVTRPLDEPLEQRRPDPTAEDAVVHREGAHLTEVLPEHVQRPAPDDPTR